MPALTLSGNEITDAVRAAALSGDGLSPEGSMGIWEATTNLAKNGGFETDTNFTRARGAATRTRVTTEKKFGTASCYVEPSAGGTFRGIIWQDSSGGSTKVPASASTVYTLSAWVKVENADTQLRIGADCYDGTPTYLGGITSSSPTIQPEQGWVRISTTGTTPVGTTQFDPEVSLVSSDGKKFYVDGFQVEQQPLATPYHETNGATATRSAASVTQTTMGDSAVTPTQGWVAMRFRINWGTSAEPGGGSGFPGFFLRAGTGSNRILLYYAESSNTIRIARDTSGPDMNNASVAFAPTLGQTYTVIAAWTATSVKISVDGVAASTASNSNIPTLNTSISIGLSGPNGTSNSDLFYFACGTGTISDADIAAIHAAGNNPSAGVFGTSAALALLWDANDSNYLDSFGKRKSALQLLGSG